MFPLIPLLEMLVPIAQGHRDHSHTEAAHLLIPQVVNASIASDIASKAKGSEGPHPIDLSYMISLFSSATPEQMQILASLIQAAITHSTATTTKS